MTTREKKQYGILVVLLLATFVVIYLNFLKPKGTPLGNISVSIPGSIIPGISGGGDTINGPFLPEGTQLDFSILEDQRFKGLNTPAYPAVTPEEIGSDNIFGQ